MKHKKLEIHVDFIGGQGPLTLEEEKSLSKYFQQKKSSVKKKIEPTRKINDKRKLETI